MYEIYCYISRNSDRIEKKQRRNRNRMEYEMEYTMNMFDEEAIPMTGHITCTEPPIHSLTRLAAGALFDSRTSFPVLPRACVSYLDDCFSIFMITGMSWKQYKNKFVQTLVNIYINYFRYRDNIDDKPSVDTYIPVYKINRKPVRYVYPIENLLKLGASTIKKDKIALQYDKMQPLLMKHYKLLREHILNIDENRWILRNINVYITSYDNLIENFRIRTNDFEVMTAEDVVAIQKIIFDLAESGRTDIVEFLVIDYNARFTSWYELLVVLCSNRHFDTAVRILDKCTKDRIRLPMLDTLIGDHYTSFSKHPLLQSLFAFAFSKLANRLDSWTIAHMYKKIYRNKTALAQLHLHTCTRYYLSQAEIDELGNHYSFKTWIKDHDCSKYAVV
jgi:hypothetical protein